MRKSVTFGFAGLAVGLVIGFFGANRLNRGTDTSSSAPSDISSAVIDPSTASTSPSGGKMPDITSVLDEAGTSPGNFVAQMKAGDVYAQIRRFDKAIEYYSRGVALQPDDLSANLVLANAYFDSGEFENAGEYYQKAIKLAPDDLNARTDLGATFVERKGPDFGRAIKEFEAVLNLDSKHEPALYYLGVAYIRSGDGENAEKTLKRLESLNPASELTARLRQNMAGK